jgi:hypothetical protein
MSAVLCGFEISNSILRRDELRLRVPIKSSFFGRERERERGSNRKLDETAKQRAS